MTNNPRLAQIDLAAEALWLADENAHPTVQHADSWDSLTFAWKTYYRHLAQAVIDALKLPVIWGVGIPIGSGDIDANANTCHTEKDARKLLASLNVMYPHDRRVVVARFGSSPWLVSGEVGAVPGEDTNQ